MTNKELAAAFQELGNLMELHGENPFKIRSYQNAYLTLRKWGTPLQEMSEAERQAIPGVGKAIADKIEQLLLTGKISTLEKYRDMTPTGVRELLAIKGLGPKKVATLWKDLGVESPGELWYACNENRLLELPGFGEKTQADVKEKLRFYFEHRHDHLYAVADTAANEVEQALQGCIGTRKLVRTGGLRRCDPVISSLEFLLSGSPEDFSWPSHLIWEEHDEQIWTGRWDDAYTIKLYWQGEQDWADAWISTTGDDDFLRVLEKKAGKVLDCSDEHDWFLKNNLPFIEPERRHSAVVWEEKALIDVSDIRGVVHAHSTWSDGLNSLEEMAEACRKQGYEYLAITDHSRAAFYANGLSEERVVAQWKEIDSLNEKWHDFKIFKGIESDILNDGSLDYSDELLSGFDLVIASVHSNLKMDEAKAMARLIKAIEHPSTNMLGHPTGRLLLSRQGYPVDHQKIIDACAANRVAIEINANPYRLDLDWTWVGRALDAGVVVSINPDAHSIGGILDIRYGVLAARKAGVTASEIVNTSNRENFQAFLEIKQ